MTFWKRRSWSIEEAPSLALSDESVVVDIGFLGGARHRDAFVELFAKLITDNAAWLQTAMLVGIDAKRSLDLEGCLGGAPPIAVASIDSQTLGRALYDSGNEHVLASLHTHDGPRVIGIKFDNPEFWLDVRAI